MKKLYLLLNVLFFFVPSFLSAQVLENYLPQQLSDQKVKIDFDVDSTWHLVHGRTSDMDGQIWFSQDGTHLIKANLNLPVASFRTGLGMRDKEMQKVMQAEKYPRVSFFLEELTNLCSDKALLSGSKCKVKVIGQLKITDISKKLRIPAQLSLEKDLLRLEGETWIDWSEYGVEDPSIMIAKLDRSLRIKFLIKLPKNK